jgi:hypothetical protein
VWHRNETRPTTYRGTRFRSTLEAKVAEQFDKMNVRWEYEVPVEQTRGWYVPDFHDS